MKTVIAAVSTTMAVKMPRALNTVLLQGRRA